MNFSKLLPFEIVILSLSFIIRVNEFSNLIQNCSNKIYIYIFLSKIFDELKIDFKKFPFPPQHYK